MITLVVMVACLLSPEGAACVRITDEVATGKECKLRAAQIETKLSSGPDILVGVIYRCEGPLI